MGTLTGRAPAPLGWCVAERQVTRRQAAAAPPAAEAPRAAAAAAAKPSSQKTPSDPPRLACLDAADASASQGCQQTLDGGHTGRGRSPGPRYQIRQALGQAHTVLCLRGHFGVYRVGGGVEVGILYTIGR